MPARSNRVGATSSRLYVLSHHFSHRDLQRVTNHQRYPDNVLVKLAPVTDEAALAQAFAVIGRHDHDRGIL